MLRSIIQERALPSITMTEEEPNPRPARGPGSDGGSNEPRGPLMGGAGSREDFGSPQWRSPGPPDADSDATREIPGLGGQWRDRAGQDRPQDHWALGGRAQDSRALGNRADLDQADLDQ